MNQDKVDEVKALLAQGRLKPDPIWCYEINLWDCPNCGTKGVEAYRLHCPNCGRNKDKKIEQGEYFSGNPRYYTLEIVNQIVDAANPSWICGRCDSPMNASLEKCLNCGSEATQDFTEQIEYKFDQVPLSSEEAYADREKRKAVQSRPRVSVTFDEQPERSKSNFFRYGLYGGIGTVVILCLIMFFWYLSATRVVSAKVTNMHWTRTITTEKLKTFRKTDWEVPERGRIVSLQEKIRYYEPQGENSEDSTPKAIGNKVVQVPCGKKKQGSGVSKVKFCDSVEPIYETKSKKKPKKDDDKAVWGTWYTYDIDEWVDGDSKTEKGDSKANVRWPIVSIFNSANEREASRYETFTITFTSDDGEDFHVTASDFNKWNAVDYNQNFRLTVNAFGVQDPKF